MNNKTILITGGTDGIGKQAAKELAQMGAQVVIVGRNPEKTAAAVAEIKAFSGSEKVDSLIAELSLMADVRKLAVDFRVKYDRLDVLFNNAGAAFGWRKVTGEGFEMTWALNHLAYFLLTHELLDMLKANPGSRIVNTSSKANFDGTIDFDNLQAKKKYSIMKVYSNSKLANIMFTIVLARRLEGSGVTANCLHPGMVDTNIGRNDNGILGRIFQPFVFGRGISVEKGADTAIYLCSSPKVATVSGEYWDKRKVVKANKEAYDVDAQERLWQVSEEMLDIEQGK